MQCFDVTSKAFTGQFNATGGVGQLVGIEKHKKLIPLLKIILHLVIQFQHFDKVLNTYKEATGSIHCVRCHQTLPVAAAWLGLMDL